MQDYFTSRCKLFYPQVQNILPVGVTEYFTCGCNPEYFTRRCKMFYPRVQKYFTCGCKIFYVRVQYFTCGCKIFYPRVQNIPEYFTHGYKIFYPRVQNILRAGAKYFTCGCKIFQNILPTGANFFVRPECPSRPPYIALVPRASHACGFRVTREWTRVGRQVARELHCTSRPNLPL